MMQQSVRFAPSQIAITSASVTSCAVMAVCIDQPTTRRENRSITADVEPALGGPKIGEVGNPFAVRSGCFEGAVEHIRSDGSGLPLTQIGRQTPPSRTCFEGLQPHQSFDPMQPAR